MDAEFRFNSPAEAVAAICARVEAVGVEELALGECAGRVLAAEVRADRDSPALDVSAMDGFAVRAGDLGGGTLPIGGEARIGAPVEELARGTAMRIVTGAPLPRGADAVVKIEDARVEGERLVLRVPGVSIAIGSYVRRCGENVRSGEVVVEAGCVLDAAKVGALAMFGCVRARVFRRVRVVIISTGDELLSAGDAAEAWQIRDGSVPGLSAMFAARAWITVVRSARARDEPEAVKAELTRALEDADAVVLTGGVSAGERDFVPGAVRALGGDVIFHKLAQRPGKPMLGAFVRGKPVLGLPGNPVSTLVTARRLAIPILGALGGCARPDAAAVRVMVSGWGDESIDLWWHRLVRRGADGAMAVVEPRSSGDVVAAAGSDGFVEVPPRGKGAGPWSFYDWGL